MSLRLTRQQRQVLGVLCAEYVTPRAVAGALQERGFMTTPASVHNTLLRLSAMRLVRTTCQRSEMAAGRREVLAFRLTAPGELAAESLFE